MKWVWGHPRPPARLSLLLSPTGILDHPPEHFGIEKAGERVAVHEDVDLVLGLVKRVRSRMVHVLIDSFPDP